MKRLASVMVVGAAMMVAPETRADVTRQQCVESYERAQILRKDSKLQKARDALVTCSQDACPSATRSDCVPWLAELDKAIPTISIGVRDENRTDVPGATITIDGAVNADAGAGRAITIDPGTHVVRADTNDGRAAELEVVARPGEKNRLVTLVLPARAAAGGGPYAMPLNPKPERPIILPLALTIVGVIGVGTAIGVGAVASGEADDLRSSACAPRCPSSDLDGVKTKLLVSDISLGVGVVALAVAAYFWIKPASSSSAASATSSGVRVRF